MGYNTRIAPSTSGVMHLGIARTAYFNWLAARATGGKFILKIDDSKFVLGPRNYNRDYILNIVDSMKWLGLDYDEMFLQSSRHLFYLDLAKQLVAERKAYYSHNGAIVLNPPRKPREYWCDEVAGKIYTTEDDMEQINQGIPLTRFDDFATYHWACVCDDIYYGVNYVIRGNEHICNTTRQIMIYDALGEPIPKYAHVGLVHQNKKRLSKRGWNNVPSVLSYRDRGIDPDAMLSLLCRMGWGPHMDDRTTAMPTRAKMLKLFLLGGKMSGSAADVDIMKLEAFNRKYKAKKAAL